MRTFYHNGNRIPYTPNYKELTGKVEVYKEGHLDEVWVDGVADRTLNGLYPLTGFGSLKS